MSETETTTIAAAGQAGVHWPADSVKRRPINDLLPYIRNARVHSDFQVAQIAASMKEWGWTIPVLTDEDGGVIAGHGRIMAAMKLGFTDVPCMTAKGWSDAKKRAYVIADNKLAMNATWDNELLRVELADLVADGSFTTDMIGFTVDEIDTVMNGWNYEAQHKDVSFDVDESVVTLKIKCPRELRDQVTTIIRDALDDNGLQHVTVA